MLNCVPLAITSFLKVPHERLALIYNQEILLSTHPARESGYTFTPDNPLRVVFMGTPQFAVPTLDVLAGDPGVALVAAYTPPDRRSGRGRVMEPSPVKARAEELRVPVFQPRRLRGEGAVAELAALDPDIIVVVAYGLLLPADVLQLPRYGCLNLHPSLLPRHRGPSPVPGAILAGDATTGITLMLLDEGMDTGPVIAQRSRELRSDDNADTLTDALFREGASLLHDTLPKWVSGRMEVRPQDEALATYTSKMDRTDGVADWGQPAEFLWRQQRAYTPWPGLHTAWNGKGIKLLDVAPSSGPAAEPGAVIRVDGDMLAVGTGDGLLVVSRLQLAGKQAANASDFIHGYPDFVGARLG